METVFELQSLHSCGGAYELVGEASRGERRVPFSLAVDEETYQEIRRCVGPEDGSRYRLSLRCKWDPFRRRYYSSVTRIEQSRRRFSYFPCSPAYRDALLRLHDTSFTPPSEPARPVFHPFKRAVHIPLLGLCLAVCIILLYYFSSVNLTIAPLSRVVQAAQQPAAPETETKAGPPVMGAGPAPAPAPALAESPESAPAGLSPGSGDGFEAGKGMPLSVALETGVVVNSLPKGFAALTFDDGPSPYTREIVDILREHDVAATFFFIGLHAQKYPGAVRYVSDHGMGVGNHSWSHISLGGGGSGRLQEEIVKTNDYLSSLTGGPVTVFRPPFGHVSDQLIDFVADRQMKIVLWNRDPRDWNSKNAQSITNYVWNTDPSGGIYVLHENELTLKALPEIIRHLKQNDMQLVVLE